MEWLSVHIPRVQFHMSSGTGPQPIPSTLPVVSLYTPLVVNVVIGLMTMIGFWMIGASLPWCYQPRRCRPTEVGRRQPPPDISLTDLAFIKKMFSLSEDNLANICGVDALVFLRFHHLGVKFFVPVCLVGLLVLLPINYRMGPISSPTTFQDLSMNHIPQSSEMFWVHFVSVVLFTAYLFYLLNREVHAYVRLRHRYHLVPDKNKRPRPEQLSVCVRRIPRRYRDEQLFQQFFAELFPNSLASAILIMDRHVLLKLVKRQEKARRQLELACSQAATRGSGSGARPVFKTKKWWFFTAETHDAISYWSHQVMVLQGEINEALRAQCEAAPVGFVSLTSFQDANAASHLPLCKIPMKFVASPAIEPRDVYWPNIHLMRKQRQFRAFVVHLLLWTLVAFWAIPVSSVSALASLPSLEEYFPWLRPLLAQSPWLRGFLQGFLPSVGLLVFQLLLPPILSYLSKVQGCSSKSSLQLSVFSKFFLFQFFNFFLVSLISTSLLQTLKQIISDPTRTPVLLSSALSLQAATFISYVLLQGLSRLPLQLLRISDLLFGSIRMKWFVHTPEDVLKATAPGPFQYAREWPMHIFVFLLGLSYAQITPLILPCVALFFVIGSFVYRYLLLFVHEPKFESGGRMFPLMLNRILTGVVVGTLTLIGMFALKDAQYQSSLLSLLLPITLYFHHHCTYIISRWEHLSIQEAADLDQNKVFDREKFKTDSQVFYRQPVAVRAAIDPNEVVNRITGSMPTLRQVPSMSAIHTLVEIEVQRLRKRMPFEENPLFDA